MAEQKERACWIKERCKRTLASYTHTHAGAGSAVPGVPPPPGGPRAVGRLWQRCHLVGPPAQLHLIPRSHQHCRLPDWPWRQVGVFSVVCCLTGHGDVWAHPWEQDFACYRPCSCAEFFVDVLVHVPVTGPAGVLSWRQLACIGNGLYKWLKCLCYQHMPVTHAGTCEKFWTNRAAGSHARYHLMHSSSLTAYRHLRKFLDKYSCRPA
eukprot:scaffold24308_cov19-Tisochrysis_lutea.AAC.1